MNTYDSIISDAKKIELFKIEFMRLVKSDPDIFCEINIVYNSPFKIHYHLKFKCSNYKSFNYLYNIITKNK